MSKSSSHEILEQIAQLLDSRVGDLTDEDGLGFHPTWNSLIQVEILAVLEERLGLAINAESILEYSNFGAIRALVMGDRND